MTTLATLLPAFDARTVHRTIVRAKPARVFAALERGDLGGPLSKMLLALRALPTALHRRGAGMRRLWWSMDEPLTLTALSTSFGRVRYDPPHELVLGLEGQFWRAVAPIRAVDADRARRPVPPGCARALWNFTVHAAPDGSSELRTETRVQCGDAASRRKFLRYWWFVRPWSGLLRRTMLQRVRRLAERADGRR